MAREDIQAQKDARYTREYQQWLESMTPAQRKKVEAMGLGQPEVSYYGNMRNEDVSEMPIASPDSPDLPDSPDIPEQKTEDAMNDASDVLRRVICELIAQPNPGLSIDCLALALNLGDTPTETEIAKKHRVSRAAVSKRCLTFIDIFDLPTPRYLKKKGSRKTYSKVQKEHHAKNRKHIESFIARSRTRRGDTKQRN